MSLPIMMETDWVIMQTLTMTTTAMKTRMRLQLAQILLTPLAYLKIVTTIYYLILQRLL